MHYDAIEQLNYAGKNSCAFIQTLGSVSLMAMQKIGELQFNFVSTQLENAMEQFQILSNPKSYKQFLSAESELAREYSLKAMDYTSKSTAILAASGNEIVALVGKGLGTTFKTEYKPAVKAEEKSARRKTGKRGS